MVNNPYIEWGDLYKLFDSREVLDDVFLNFEAKIIYTHPDYGIPFDIWVRHKDKTWEKSYCPFYEPESKLPTTNPNPKSFYDTMFKYGLVEELKGVIRELNINEIIR